MSFKGFQILDFQQFTATTTVIELPPNLIWFRGASSYLNGLPENTPLFLSMKHVADFYTSGDPTRHLECYRNPQTMRVLDVRFLQMVIPYILTNRKEPINQGTHVWYKKLCIAFGGCSAACQLELLKEITDGKPYPPIQQLETYMQTLPEKNRDTRISPIEPLGFRIAITNFDYDVISILKILFHNIDGFIAPNLFSPAHNQSGENNLFPELILFHPKRSLVPIPIPTLNDLSMIPVLPMESLVVSNSDPLFVPANCYINLRIQKGGSSAQNMALWEERDAYLMRMETSKRLREPAKALTCRLARDFSVVASLNPPPVMIWKK